MTYNNAVGIVLCLACFLLAFTIEGFMGIFYATLGFLTVLVLILVWGQR